MKHSENRLTFCEHDTGTVNFRYRFVCNAIYLSWVECICQGPNGCMLDHRCVAMMYVSASIGSIKNAKLGARFTQLAQVEFAFIHETLLAPNLPAEIGSNSIYIGFSPPTTTKSPNNNRITRITIFICQPTTIVLIGGAPG